MEIKTHDLMLGNYVKINNKVVKIDYRIFYAILNQFTGYKALGIPITEQWLIYLGFYYSDDDNEFLELEIMHKIKIYADNSNDFSTAVLRLKENEVEIKYVHQLQNLYFSLTNQQLTLKK